MADRAGLLNRCRDLNPYREFESHPLRFLFKPTVKFAVGFFAYIYAAAAARKEIFIQGIIVCQCL